MFWKHSSVAERLARDEWRLKFPIFHFSSDPWGIRYWIHLVVKCLGYLGWLGVSIYPNWIVHPNSRSSSQNLKATLQLSGLFQEGTACMDHCMEHRGNLIKRSESLPNFGRILAQTKPPIHLRPNRQSAIPINSNHHQQHHDHHAKLKDCLNCCYHEKHLPYKTPSFVGK
jgi:hypothetical protein